MHWLAFAALCGITISFRCFRSSFAPSVFTGFFWTVYLGPSLFLMEKLEPAGIGALVILIICIQVGAFAAEQVTPKRETYTVTFKLNRLVILFTVSALLAIAYLVKHTVTENGLDYSFLGLMQVGGIWTLNRYARIYEPWVYRLLIIWFHPACLFGGIVFASQKKKLLPLLSLVPPLLCTVFTGARAAFLLALVCWLGGYWAVLNMRGETRFISPRRVLWIGLVATSLFGMFFFVDYVRSTPSDNAGLAAEIDRKHLYDYAFGSPAAFSKWFVGDDHAITGGAMTFPSVFEAIGAKPRDLGLYDKEVVVISGYYTNVYTAFRGLIQDFTYGGAFIVCLLFGYWSGTAYRNRTIWLSIFYAAMLYSPIVCLFIYNGTILAWVCLAFCVYNIRLRTAIPFIGTPEQSPNG